MAANASERGGKEGEHIPKERFCRGDVSAQEVLPSQRHAVFVGKVDEVRVFRDALNKSDLFLAGRAVEAGDADQRMLQQQFEHLDDAFGTVVLTSGLNGIGGFCGKLFQPAPRVPIENEKYFHANLRDRRTAAIAFIVSQAAKQ